MSGTPVVESLIMPFPAPVVVPQRAFSAKAKVRKMLSLTALVIDRIGRLLFFLAIFIFQFLL